MTSDQRSNWTLHMPRVRLPQWMSTMSYARVTSALIAIVVSSGLFVFGLLQTDLFAVQRIDVNGLAHVSKPDAVALAGLKVGEPMINIDEDKAATKLETNPWIQEAHVKSAWPHVVTVSIVERTPIGIAQTTDNKWAQIGSLGVVLQVSETPATGLPVFLGVKVSPEAGSNLDASTRTVVEVAQLMPPSLQSHVRQIQDQDNQVKLGLDTNTIVELGDSTELSDKLMAAATVISHTDAKKLSVLDVRSPRLPVATPVGASAAPTPSTTPTTNKSTSSTSQKPSNSGVLGKSSTTTVRSTTSTTRP